MSKPEPAASLPRPSFGEAVRFWLKLGFISFGGPAGQIALMHRELVEKKRWMSEGRFLHALNYCMLLPGPEAQQLATYSGWLLHGTRGGLAAGVLFILPSAFILWGLSWAYMTVGNLPWVAALFYGLKPAVLAIVAGAVLRVGKRVLRNPWMFAVAAGAFLALALFGVPFPAVVIGASLVGWWGGRWWPEAFAAMGTSEEAAEVDGPVAPLPTPGRMARVVLMAGTLWWAPILAAGCWLGSENVIVQQGLFFSKTAMVTFGGAYAVLPYVSQQGVEHFGWLSTSQMIDGMGLAETTPGPLIMVLQFVGFVGAWQHPGSFSPLFAATLGAVMTTWTTFAPCFLWIFLGAPYVERFRGHRRLNAALSAITAAVVGVILNLAVWFGSHVLHPAPGRWDGLAVGIAIVVFAGLVRWKWDMTVVIAVGALTGLAGYLVFG